ncbi:MAG: DUF2779 domain-containing protein, partial [Nanoarchaeota archaeon]|nr:DUF2779 domain-containing protein [Nanoarchaeota archaeon]
MLLTKSNYLIGLQCPKYLWMVFHEPEEIPEASLSDKFKFKQGEEVGELAKTLFPKGIDLPVHYVENLKKTIEALKEKKPLFEAGFEVNNCFSRVDILVPNKDKWDIIEVKSSTKIKDINIHDVSFQKYCLEKSGLKIGKCFLMHVNNEYVRKGKIEPKKLLIKEDITKDVNEIKNVEDKIEDMFDIITSPTCPEHPIGKHCKDPYDCPICSCWDKLPENHVFCLYKGGRLSYELYENGIESIKDIPSDIKLNDKQGIQRDCEINNKVHVNKDEIKKFLDKLKYPLYFLDFETFSTAIPMFDGLKPYSQIPFQFSLHVVEKEGSEPEHYEFLYSGSGDPRKEFLIELKKVLGSDGSIVVYNQGFEVSRLKELGECFLEYKDWVA